MNVRSARIDGVSHADTFDGTISVARRRRIVPADTGPRTGIIDQAACSSLERKSTWRLGGDAVSIAMEILVIIRFIV